LIALVSREEKRSPISVRKWNKMKKTEKKERKKERKQTKKDKE